VRRVTLPSGEKEYEVMALAYPPLDDSKA